MEEDEYNSLCDQSSQSSQVIQINLPQKSAKKQNETIKYVQKQESHRSPIKQNQKFYEQMDQQLIFLKQDGSYMNWKDVAKVLSNQFYVQLKEQDCEQRWNQLIECGLHKGNFSNQQTQNLIDLYQKHGTKYQAIKHDPESLLIFKSKQAMRNKLMSVFRSVLGDLQQRARDYNRSKNLNGYGQTYQLKISNLMTPSKNRICCLLVFEEAQTSVELTRFKQILLKIAKMSRKKQRYSRQDLLQADQVYQKISEKHLVNFWFSQNNNRLQKFKKNASKDQKKALMKRWKIKQYKVLLRLFKRFRNNYKQISQSLKNEPEFSKNKILLRQQIVEFQLHNLADLAINTFTQNLLKMKQTQEQNFNKNLQQIDQEKISLDANMAQDLMNDFLQGKHLQLGNRLFSLALEGNAYRRQFFCNGNVQEIYEINEYIAYLKQARNKRIADKKLPMKIQVLTYM